MSNLNRTKSLYILINQEGGISGVYTTKKVAVDAADPGRGDIMHVVSVGVLDTELSVTDYTPPSVPTLGYGPADGFDAEEMPDLDPQRVAEMEDYYNEAVQDQSGYQTPITPVTAPPKALSPKDLILAKLARELDVEEENHDEDFIPEPDPQPVRGGFQPQPQGGFTQTNPTGVGGHGVEYFSPLG